jgi:uncharacterized protein YbjT (DUF2867 family)
VLLVRVAVLGASGTVGRSLVPVLAERHDVVAVSRRRRRSESGETWQVADATDPDAMRRVLDEAEVVYHLVHSLGSRHFEARDRRAADVVAAVAERSGARQIVYLGGLGDGECSPSAHLRSRAETARRLAGGAVPVTTLRAAMVVARESASFELVRALVDRLPVMICPRWIGVRTQPVALGDVVRYLAGVAGRPQTLGETYDVGGPEVMTHRTVIERVARLRGRRPLIAEVPVLTPRLSALWLHLVTPVAASVSRPLVDGLRVETVARDERIRALVPFEPTPFDEAARTALAAA